MATLTPLPLPPSLAGSLDRQAARRCRGVPTISVLRGPPGPALRSWRRWLTSRQQPLLVCTEPRLDALARRWTLDLARRRNLVGDALDALASWLGRPPGEVRAGLAGKTLADLESFWEALGLDRTSDVVAACALLVRSLILGESPLPEQVFDRLVQALRGNDQTELRVVAALTELTPQPAWPAILLAPEERLGGPGRWLARAGRTAAALANRLPRLTLALTVPGDVLDAHLRSAPESQVLALLREGLTEVPVLEETAITRQVQDQGAPVALLAPAIRQVAACGADEGLVASLSEAARAVASLDEADGVSVDRARSAAERFLHELLESHPTTAGLFEVNGPLDFRFGTRPAEVDLLARDLRLAVELDGQHWHTRDPDAYRRDRRKDWELQRRGYLVLRFLAEDVVCRLEEILGTILAAVRHRRQLAEATGGTE